MTNLARFRVDADPDLVPALAHIVPFEAKFTGSILAFDQSLANTGWVILACSSDGEIKLVQTGMIRTSEDDKAKGFEADLQRAVEIHKSAAEIITKMWPPPLPTVAHEMPSAKSRFRSTASLLSALSIRIAADQAEADVIMVAAQVAKKRITGNSAATKKELGEGLTRLFPQILEHSPMNEHTRDAVAVGLCAIETKNRES